MRIVVSFACLLGLLLAGCNRKKEVVEEERDKPNKQVVVSKDRLDLAHLPDGYIFAVSLRPGQLLEKVAKDPEQRRKMLDLLRKAVPVPNVGDLQQVVLATDEWNFVDMAMALQGRREEKVSPKEDDVKGSPESFDESLPERTESFDRDEEFQREDKSNPLEGGDSTSQFDALPLEDDTYFVTAAAEDDDLEKLLQAHKPARGEKSRRGVILVLKYRKPVDAMEYIKAWYEDVRPIEAKEHTVQKHTFHGKTFITTVAGMGVLVIDEQTLMVMPVEELPEVLGADPTSYDPLKAELRSYKPTGEFHASFVMPDELREQVKPIFFVGDEIPANMQVVTRLPDTLQTASLQVSLSGKSLARLTVKTNDKTVTGELESAARDGVKQLQQLLTLFGGAASKSPGGAEAVTLAKDLLTGINIETHGNTCVIEVARPDKMSLAMAIKMSETLANLIAGAEKQKAAAHNHGRVWLEKGEYDKALENFNEAIRINPKDANAYYIRGLAWRELGEKDKAEANFREAKRLDPRLEE